jgi:DNA-binding GntR family transcriptional regulator
MNAGKPMPEGPLYLGVKRRILERLAAGEWKPGDRLPTEPELAARFGVAISTVRAGLADLSSAGIVVKRQGEVPRSQGKAVRVKDERKASG